ncbi:MAG: molybdopterin molybdenumtransferase MoeA, partial [Chitinophagaceae bacterium]|nr:molybdopterin molybdenumtransferase MoeA [Chitinophagaceae bacterium]
MISVLEARKIIEEQTQELGTELRRLDAGLNYVLRNPLSAPIDSPPFDQSAMDGYAFHFNSKGPVASYQLQGMIQAGDTQHYQVEEGCCFRIFTGAPIPHGADTVIMQEHC